MPLGERGNSVVNEPRAPQSEIQASPVVSAPQEPPPSRHFDVAPNPENPEELVVRLFTCSVGVFSACTEQPMPNVNIALIDSEGTLLESNQTDARGEATVLAETAFISRAYLAIDGTVVGRSQAMLQTAARESIQQVDTLRREREVRQELTEAAEQTRAEAVSVSDAATIPSLAGFRLGSSFAVVIRRCRELGGAFEASGVDAICDGVRTPVTISVTSPRRDRVTFHNLVAFRFCEGLVCRMHTGLHGCEAARVLGSVLARALGPPVQDVVGTDQISVGRAFWNVGDAATVAWRTVLDLTARPSPACNTSFEISSGVATIPN